MARASQLDSAERLFRALADPVRLRLLNLMAGQEVCVCYFVEILKLHQPKISRHLAYLRKSGLVEARRDGKWMHYRIAALSNPALVDLLRRTLDWIGRDPQMQHDRERLQRACCTPQKFARLEGAPVPAPLRNRSSH